MTTLGGSWHRLDTCQVVDGAIQADPESTFAEYDPLSTHGKKTSKNQGLSILQEFQLLTIERKASGEFRKVTVRAVKSWYEQFGFLGLFDHLTKKVVAPVVWGTPSPRDFEALGVGTKVLVPVQHVYTKSQVGWICDRVQVPIEVLRKYCKLTGEVDPWRVIDDPIIRSTHLDPYVEHRQLDGIAHEYHNLADYLEKYFGSHKLTPLELHELILRKSKRGKQLFRKKYRETITDVERLHACFEEVVRNWGILQQEASKVIAANQNREKGKARSTYDARLFMRPDREQFKFHWLNDNVDLTTRIEIPSIGEPRISWNSSSLLSLISYIMIMNFANNFSVSVCPICKRSFLHRSERAVTCGEQCRSLQSKRKAKCAKSATIAESSELTE